MSYDPRQTPHLHIPTTHAYAYRRGYSYFTLATDTHSHMRCKVCDAECFAERNLRAPRGMAESVAYHNGQLSKTDLRPFDRFTCPNAEHFWHKEAQALAIERDTLQSPGLRAVVQSDLDNLLRKHTKAR